MTQSFIILCLARERLLKLQADFFGVLHKVSRLGVIPRPTVIVRMIENGMTHCALTLCAHVRLPFPLDIQTAL